MRGGACNLIVIGRRSLVNASRHLRQTTRTLVHYTMLVIGGRLAPAISGVAIAPTPRSHAFTGRYNMLHRTTAAENAHVMVLHVPHSMFQLVSIGASLQATLYSSSRLHAIPPSNSFHKSDLKTEKGLQAGKPLPIKTDCS